MESDVSLTDLPVPWSGSASFHIAGRCVARHQRPVDKAATRAQSRKKRRRPEDRGTRRQKLRRQPNAADRRPAPAAQDPPPTVNNDVATDGLPSASTPVEFRPETTSDQSGWDSHSVGRVAITAQHTARGAEGSQVGYGIVLSGAPAGGGAQGLAEASLVSEDRIALWSSSAEVALSTAVRKSSRFIRRLIFASA